jgi:hypothetical protein
LKRSGSERKRRIQAALAERQLDLLVCALPMNVLMISGYWPAVRIGVTDEIPTELRARKTAVETERIRIACEIADGAFAVLAARKAALRAIRPGVSAASVDHEARQKMQGHGFDAVFEHSTSLRRASSDWPKVRSSDSLPMQPARCVERSLVRAAA